MSAVARAVWRTRLRRWGGSTDEPVPGYTLLVPVPGDLPVFLRIALAVCKLQDPEHRVATFVIPDVMTDAMRSIVDQERSGWSGPLELLHLPVPERALLPRLGDPGRNHAYQIITGVKAASSSHVVLHDADLFLPAATAHRQQFERASGSGCPVLGVEAAWDPWFAERGRTLAATWEMVAEVSWLKSFPPHRLMGHDAAVEGAVHTFDTTFWGQLHSAPDSIRIAPPDGGIVHFNYVISTYRKFVRTQGPFHDKMFRLLLIRAFVDLFDPGATMTGLPELDELVTGLRDARARVVYKPSDADVYVAFRRKFSRILQGPWAGGDDVAEAYLGPFDQFFGAAAEG